jgi:hypothetical protein
VISDEAEPAVIDLGLVDSLLVARASGTVLG